MEGAEIAAVEELENTVVKLDDLPPFPMAFGVRRCSLSSSAISMPMALKIWAHKDVPLRCIPSTTTIRRRWPASAIAAMRPFPKRSADQGKGSR